MDYRFAREKGMKIYALTPDQVSEWRAGSAPVLEAFMMNTGEPGPPADGGLWQAAH